jgi:hypothetical protein
MFGLRPCAGSCSEQRVCVTTVRGGVRLLFIPWRCRVRLGREAF